MEKNNYVTISKDEYQKLLIANNMYNSYLCSDGLYSMDKTAKIIKFDGGRNKLLDRMRSDGILMKTSENTPHQKYFDLGYFEMKLSNKYDYGDQLYFVLYTTHRGIKWLFRRYGKPKEDLEKIVCTCFDVKKPEMVPKKKVLGHT